MIESETTLRGFSKLVFTDLYAAECSIQASSIATTEAIWFGRESANPQILASQAPAHGISTEKTTGWVEYPIPDEVLLSTRMHLTREQVADLLPILQRFVETGELYAG